MAKQSVLNPLDSAILTLDPHDIEIGSRIGFVWPEKAKALGVIMKRDGQIEPIHVRRNGPQFEKPWALVVGGHRTFGAIYSGIKILALEAKGNADELKLMEASENMLRRDIGPIEKSMFVRAMADIYEARFFEEHDGKTPQQVAALRRWSSDEPEYVVLEKLGEPVKLAALAGTTRGNNSRLDSVAVSETKKAEIEASHLADTIAGLYGWQTEAADALGMSDRSLRDYLFIHRSVVTVAGTDESQGGRAHALARHPLGEKRKSVIEIGGIVDVPSRKAIIDLIASDYGHEIKSVGEAKIKWGLKPAKSPAPEGQSKYMANATANLDRLSAASWKSLAPVIAGKIKPSALKDMRDAIDARISAGEAE